MDGPPKRIAVLGSTGSIGTNTLAVIGASDGRFGVFGLSAHRQLDVLVEQARRFRPAVVVASDEARARRFDWSGLPPGTERLYGAAGLRQLAAAAEVDVVVAAIVGSAGLASTWAALEAGKTVALANKETLVVAGRLATDLAEETGATILPVDSEHSGVFQLLPAGRRGDVRQVILTASGGPFRRRRRDELDQVTVAEALSHPTWEMGPKITIDSATMMNKALEIIEARWLFQLAPAQIDVVVHPQSIVHALVEFVDGSVVAQLSPPDMKLPIQVALDYPDCRPGIAARLDWRQPLQLDFEPADFDRFPALALGLEAARVGGTAGAVLNAANEAAVARFLAHELQFTDIVPACQSVLKSHHFDPQPTLERLQQLDSWAREEVSRWPRS